MFSVLFVSLTSRRGSDLSLMADYGNDSGNCHSVLRKLPRQVLCVTLVQK